MGKKNLRKFYNLSLTQEWTGRQVRSVRFTRLGAVVAAFTAFVVILGSLYALIALTPLRTTIPGYPDAHFRRVAVDNAIRIDSLEAAIARWQIYSENLSRALSGDTTIDLDSLLSRHEAADSLSR